MGKHNGKARKAGLPVGASLKNKARREGKTNPSLAHLHTTDLGDGHNMQSVLETNDLDELMTMVRTWGVRRRWGQAAGPGGRADAGGALHIATRTVRLLATQGFLAPGCSAQQNSMPQAEQRALWHSGNTPPLPRSTNCGPPLLCLTPATPRFHRPRWRGATSARRSST